MKAKNLLPDAEIARIVGTRIKQIRLSRGLTMQRAATRVGISKGFLSKIERGQKAPAISTLINIATAFNVNLSSLLEPDRREQRISFVKKGERPPAFRYASAFGYRFASLAHKVHHKHMQPFVVMFPQNPKREGAGLQHPGEEFVMTLQGKILFTVGEQEFVMDPGDSLYFDSSIPHWERSLTKGDSEAIDISFTPPE